MLALAWDNSAGAADLAYEDEALREGDELVSAVLLSLFCDAPARPDDDVPAGQPRNGWWADALDTEHPGDHFGSRLWLLRRRPMTGATADEASEMATEALRWMVEDGVAQSAIGTAEVRDGALWVGAFVRRPGDVAPSLIGMWEAVL